MRPLNLCVRCQDRALAAAIFATAKSDGHLVANHAPCDLALVDVDDADGLALVESVRRNGNIPVVAFGSELSLAQVLDIFAAGVDDYVRKPFDMAELMARVDAVARRSGLATKVWKAGDLLVDEDAMTVMRSGRLLSLTMTEHRILILLIRRHTEVVTYEEIADAVWGTAVPRNLIQFHVSGLRGKLESLSEERVIFSVRPRGYRLFVPAQ